MASSSSSPCAACKFLRRKCTPECVFAPYFPPDQPHKFANVHKIFGASNITKLLNELPPHQREDAVNSLAYEADARVKDPVYGCVGAISMLQRQVARLQHELAIAQQDLARYTSASVPMVAVAAAAQQHPHPQHPHPHQQQHQQSPQAHPPQAGAAHLGIGQQQQHEQQMFTRDQLLEIAREQHLTREQVMDIARIGGGSYEAGLAVLGLSPLGPFAASSTRGSGSESGASGGGSSGGGFYH
ncbi:protein LATERAL ORGAN BOUNDARIES [Selaginella moellendorffii]|uniref:protein LATERAL ORGAN BOUNDARIES n=1 Tax=Selaginella moellendorffii TaxID=88036 RepID=UPI000D1C5B3C|nr:protein LATERAL ORGAN BOUNDARIES [Selaginella moellendorffii]XP_024539312.1 protein LATERAL ORGAN BOUNDARIES [Selaginella moellendorffii]XP_024539313.1 protein LATERAL ORGAN BOUNDARIES [Selaginella moellendorffii]XP_024539314.1 protein LATERAL ORGAN BOUNDARIES [Selaginella moellendorffii]|eukprot:XP_024539311.1 protein LATERAL ORGAN BOUNDARIES [Selaginella moellendorffii]